MARKAVGDANAPKSAEALKDIAAVLDYVAEAGRKVAKSKLYEDVKKGHLRRQPDGSFLLKHVDRYLLSLPSAGSDPVFADDAEKRLKRMEEAKIRRAVADAEMAEFNLERQKGLYVKRDDVLVELAGRAVALREGLKSAFEGNTPELVEAVAGDAQKVPALRMVIERIIDTSMGEYAKPMRFEVEVVGVEAASAGGDDE